jgi:hypothetical protein
MYRAYILSKSARSPRFRTERENRVQRVVADGPCDLHPARALGCGSGSRHTAYRRPLWSGELVIATVSGPATPVEIPKIAQLASMYEWQ